MARPRTVLTPKAEKAEKHSAPASGWTPPAEPFRVRRLVPAVGAATYHATLRECEGVQAWITEPSIIEWLNRSAWSPVPAAGSPWWMAMWEILGREPE